MKGITAQLVGVRPAGPGNLIHVCADRKYSSQSLIINNQPVGKIIKVREIRTQKCCECLVKVSSCLAVTVTDVGVFSLIRTV